MSYTLMALHTIDSAELEKMLEKASCRGAEMALANVGLTDDQAIHDIRDLRDLLDTFKDIKRSIIKSAASLITAAVLGLIAASVWFHK